MKRLARLILATSALLILPSVANAATIIINAIANTTDYGYTEGQTVTLTFNLNDASLLTNDYRASETSKYQWYDEYTNDIDLWTSITGDGLTGTWTRRIDGSTDPFSEFTSNLSDNNFSLVAGTDSSSQYSGLFTNGYDIKYITLSLTPSSLDLSELNYQSNLAEFVNEYAGTYAVNAGSIVIFTSDNEYRPYDFLTFTSFEFVATSTVPEPSTYAAIAGLGALALAFAARRKRKA